MDIIDFVKNEYWLDPSHGQQGLESSPNSVEYRGCYAWMQQQTDLSGFIEIGSAFGGSFHLWSTLISTGKKISIDMEPKGQYPQNLTRERMNKRNDIWRSHFSDVNPILGDSHLEVIVDRVDEILGGELVSWLFIDGDHRYSGAKSDYEMYKKFVRPGGFIGFHDIRMMKSDMGDGGPGCGVFWSELIATGQYKFWEFADIIGVIQV